ncbi:SAM domain-containing protein [Tieghemostelium lacteum]|uniref:SAM domain-containing protein n=1 Tax=Tieghemostelium lacteum TaxID=361077 RepID=A0A151ZE96_TIELA|nr:SAM domain-containing protein [Tieghemostelium lacteum]|eukprot:KYQ92271.1 SAM domain-containing protein [Tieghemostelium lacteum]
MSSTLSPPVTKHQHKRKTTNGSSPSSIAILVTEQYENGSPFPTHTNKKSTNLHPSALSQSHYNKNPSKKLVTPLSVLEKHSPPSPPQPKSNKQPPLSHSKDQQPQHLHKEVSDHLAIPQQQQQQQISNSPKKSSNNLGFLSIFKHKKPNIMNSQTPENMSKKEMNEKIVKSFIEIKNQVDSIKSMIRYWNDLSMNNHNSNSNVQITQQDDNCVDIDIESIFTDLYVVSDSFGNRSKLLMESIQELQRDLQSNSTKANPQRLILWRSWEDIYESDSTFMEDLIISGAFDISIRLILHQPITVEEKPVFLKLLGDALCPEIDKNIICSLLNIISNNIQIFSDRTVSVFTQLLQSYINYPRGSLTLSQKSVNTLFRSQSLFNEFYNTTNQLSVERKRELDLKRQTYQLEETQSRSDLCSTDRELNTVKNDIIEASNTIKSLNDQLAQMQSNLTKLEETQSSLMKIHQNQFLQQQKRSQELQLEYDNYEKFADNTLIVFEKFQQLRQCHQQFFDSEVEKLKLNINKLFQDSRHALNNYLKSFNKNNNNLNQQMKQQQKIPDMILQNKSIVDKLIENLKDFKETDGVELLLDKCKEIVAFLKINFDI